MIEEISFSKSMGQIPPEELIHYYKAADVFAMTSTLETFGIVLIEAMAADIPVVCFDAPGIRDVMNRKCGKICAQGDIEGFAKKLCEAMAENEYSGRNVECLEYARQYSWEAVAAKYLQAYETAITRCAVA